LTEQSSLAKDTPVLLVEGHARQISRLDSQDGRLCCQYCDRDYTV